MCFGCWVVVVAGAAVGVLVVVGADELVGLESLDGVVVGVGVVFVVDGSLGVLLVGVDVVGVVVSSAANTLAG